MALTADAHAIVRLDRAADRVEAILDDAQLNITFSELVEACALVAARKADKCLIGSVNEASWTNASGRLFDLAQVGRLYAERKDTR